MALEAAHFVAGVAGQLFAAAGDLHGGYVVLSVRLSQDVCLHRCAQITATCHMTELCSNTTLCRCLQVTLQHGRKSHVTRVKDHNHELVNTP